LKLSGGDFVAKGTSSTCTVCAVVVESVSTALPRTQIPKLTAYVAKQNAVHGDVTTVTLTAHGVTCLRVAIAAIRSLRAAGVKPIRLVDDVVSRSEIARRIGITPQSDGQWIRGERHSESPFPAPYILTDGGLWLPISARHSGTWRFSS
jgi:hypothetical protein